MKPLAAIVFAVLFIAVVTAAIILSPRREPNTAVGRYVQFGLGPVVLDTTNGHLCVDYPESTSPNDYPPICSWVKPWTPSK